MVGVPKAPRAAKMAQKMLHGILALKMS